MSKASKLINEEIVGLNWDLTRGRYLKAEKDLRDILAKYQSMSTRPKTFTQEQYDQMSAELEVLISEINMTIDKLKFYEKGK